MTELGGTGNRHSPFCRRAVRTAFQLLHLPLVDVATPWFSIVAFLSLCYIHIPRTDGPAPQRQPIIPPKVIVNEVNKVNTVSSLIMEAWHRLALQNPCVQRVTLLLKLEDEAELSRGCDGELIHQPSCFNVEKRCDRDKFHLVRRHLNHFAPANFKSLSNRQLSF